MDSARASRFRILASAALFSTGGAAIKACALTPWQVASFRSAVGALAILVMAPMARRGWSWRTFVVGPAYAATVLLFVLANRLTTSADAIFLQSTAPLYMLLIGPWLLREPIRRTDLGFMGALALGLALFFVGVEKPSGTAPDPALGNVLAAASGLSWALTMAGLRWLSKGPQPASAAVSATVAGNLMAGLFALPFALPVAPVAASDWALVVGLGVFQIGLAYVLLTRATLHVPALECTLLLLLEPVLNPVWAWIVHGETPGPWSLAGGAIILVATVHRARGRAEATAPAGPVGGEVP